MTTEPEPEVKTAEAEASEEESQLADALGKLALASIGAVSLAEEAAENLLRRLVVRGEADWQNAQRTLGKLRTARPRLPRPSRPVLAIGAGDLASKSDVQALEQRLDALSAQVAGLNKRSSDEA
jgi:polyhydroxyalkanoate synthesis regulator phasin